LFLKLPEKIDFFTLIHDPPDFKPDWRRCSKDLCMELPHSYFFLKIMLLPSRNWQLFWSRLL